MSDSRLPAIFIGHGNPMHAIGSNGFTNAWKHIGASLPRPRAILCISAHWYVRGVKVTAQERPRTIHDFGGFPEELFRVEYPAPGEPRLAARVRELLAPVDVEMDHSWGLDHGTWSVLVHAFPQADVPVVQLSLDRTAPPSFHYDLGKRLAPLRDEGVLVLGSGNLVHNLHAATWGEHPVAPYAWAVEFEDEVRRLLAAGDHGPLIAYEKLGEKARLSVPTPDHYLPLLYVIGQAGAKPPTYPVEGFDMGSISMLSVRVD